jgi:hypothetical protein
VLAAFFSLPLCAGNTSSRIKRDNRHRRFSPAQVEELTFYLHAFETGSDLRGNHPAWLAVTHKSLGVRRRLLMLMNPS